MSHKTINAPTLAAFAVLAADYCQTVEQHERTGRDAFLHRVHLLLPQLYAAGLLLPSTDVLYDEEDEGEVEEWDAPSEEVADSDMANPHADPDRLTSAEWQTLYASLSGLIGEQRHYREIFDPYEPEAEKEVTGSLADDLADIYQDMLDGLRKWQRGESGEALWEWRFHLECHWGEHVTGALRALHALASSHGLGWPPSGADGA